MSSTQKIKTAILGASGYTGAELLRLLQFHPNVELVALTAETQAGKNWEEVFPHLRAEKLPPLVKHGEVDFAKVDLVFCCLPHGTTQEIIAGLPAHVRVVDLSADFRLHDLDAYAHWYGHAHHAPELQKNAVYGLTEHAREAVKKARLVANPGCYPTSILLPTLPLVEAGLIEAETIIADSLSGVSGAGRSVKQNLLFTEVNEGVSAYGIGHHRHMAEIEQELSRTAKSNVKISFTPHLMPMQRGIHSTIHVTLKGKTSAADLEACLKKRYANDVFVQVVNAATPPATHHVRGTNLCMMAVYADRQLGKAIITSVIDNLVKGASGQAIQNMNVMFGLDETLALPRIAVLP